MACRLAVVVAVTATLPSAAQTLSKGHGILLEHGIQLTAMVTRDDVFHLDTFRSAGLNMATWLWSSSPTWLGPPPGFPWARWATNQADMPCNAQELPYAASLIAVQLGDEQNLNDPAIRASAAAWYAAVRDQYPNTILYSNSYGGQVTNPNLEDFINTSHPDMLSFDTYPFNPGGPTGGSPTNLYGDMQRYRKFALAHGIPYAMYTQTFHDSVTRDPSESEMRLEYFAGAAFGFTWFNGFTYNTGASTLFTSPGGDSHPNARYGYLQEITRRIKLLSPALTRLLSADVRFINGQHLNPSSGATVTNATPIDVQNWQFGVNDLYLRGWVVTNLGAKNDGLRGDVVLSWFKILDEEFDTADYANEIYFMVANGLTAPDGTAADCRQEIKLNFLFNDPTLTGVLRLNQSTGQAEIIELPVLPNTGDRRQLSLSYDGGTAELFKFHTGAPFVGVSSPPDTRAPHPVSNFTAQAGYRQITLSWTNPSDLDFKGTMLRRKQNVYPTGPTDGTLVVDQPGASASLRQYTDSGLTPRISWCYAAFSHDAGPNYAGGATVAAIPFGKGDFDLDGDTDQADFGFLQTCISGAARPFASGCDVADFDEDGDVDAADIFSFQSCMDGPGMPSGC